MKKCTPFYPLVLIVLFLFSCKESTTEIMTPKGMIWVEGGTFLQGAVPKDKQAMMLEKPQHKVTVDGFFIDQTEVTNAQFSKFVEATGYITTAEKKVDWNELKKQLPKGTPKPHDSILQPGSLIFKKTSNTVPNHYDFSQWWKWEIDANWRHPKGKNSSIIGKENYPVVHITYEDALAYCKWANRRLPTEAEWEFAARGTKKNTIYFWGNDESILHKQANSWEGEFPVSNTKKDGYESIAPVKSYPPNSLGIYDMAGNVWEFTSDWFNVNYYKELTLKNTTTVNPTGAKIPYNPSNPYLKEKIIKGGSFLCNASYCASYRISSRMGNHFNSSTEHVGFRTVATKKMLE